jgi:hypothetical protein
MSGLKQPGLEVGSRLFIKWNCGLSLLPNMSLGLVLNEQRDSCLHYVYPYFVFMYSFLTISFNVTFNSVYCFYLFLLSSLYPVYFFCSSVSLNKYRASVVSCNTIKAVKHSGRFTYHMFEQKNCILCTRCICVFYYCSNKQRFYT